MGNLGTFVVGFAAGALVSFILLAMLRPWLSAVAAGAPIPVVQVIGMQLRREPVHLILDAHIALQKGGQAVDLGVVEAVYLAHRSDVENEQDLVSLVQEHAETIPRSGHNK